MIVAVRHIVAFLLTVIISLGVANAQQSDTTIVKSLLEEAFFYNSGSSNYLPLVTTDYFKGKTVHFELNKSEMNDLLLQIGSNQAITVFFNQKLVAKIKQGTSAIWPTDSLFEIYGNKIHCTIYNRHLSVKSLTISLLAVSDHLSEEFAASEDVIILNQRKTQHVFNNFLIIGVIIIMAFLATLYNYYPRVTTDFLKFSRALAFREMDENLLKSRPFSWINILFYIFFSLLAGYLLVFIFYLASFELISNFESIWLAIWFWLKVSGAVMLWLIVKYIIISNFTSLFNIKGFLQSHYFNNVRIGFLIFLFTGVLMIVSYLGFDIRSTGFYITLFNLLLVAISLRTVFIMFKLMNSASYKFLHLFSYLCGTEIIPLGIILFLGFNQPF